MTIITAYKQKNINVVIRNPSVCTKQPATVGPTKLPNEKADNHTPKKDNGKHDSKPDIDFAENVSPRNDFLYHDSKFMTSKMRSSFGETHFRK